MKIGIVGHGFVGQAVEFAFKDKCEIVIADPKYGTSIDDVFDCKFVFVCVPTPMGPNGMVDDSILAGVVNTLEHRSNCTIIIKSTITPVHLHTMVQSMRTDHIVYNPEFLTEANANKDFVRAEFHVLGGDPLRCSDVEYLYRHHSMVNPSAKFYTMSAVEASFVKYGINSFLATKVTFFNQLFDECEKWGANFDTVAGMMSKDARVGVGHNKVPGPDGKRGFGGACLPKDTAAILFHSGNQMSLLQQVLTINADYRKVYDLDEREKVNNITFGETA